VVDQNKISLGYLGEIKNDRDRKDATPDNTGESSLLSSVTYSVAQIVPFVNSKDLLRYFPDEMLDKEQRSVEATKPSSASARSVRLDTVLVERSENLLLTELESRGIMSPSAVI
jgi:hypothetical protein